MWQFSGVARALPGVGKPPHPEDQNEEENEEKLRKNERNYKKWGKIVEIILSTWEWEAGYGPVWHGEDLKVEKKGKFLF